MIRAIVWTPSIAQLKIFSPHTEVLVLVIANYHFLLSSTLIPMASEVLQIQPLWTALSGQGDSITYLSWIYRMSTLCCKIFCGEQDNQVQNLFESRISSIQGFQQMLSEKKVLKRQNNVA